MIPAAFAERFLWKAPCNLDDSPQPESDNIPSPSVQQPTFTFSPAVLAELDSVFSLAFVEAEKKQSKLLKLAMDAPNPGHTPPVGAEISIALSCPQYQGTPILDAAVKHIAEECGAEVLVLDAFEIASGRFGVLGKSGRVIDELYEAIPRDGEPWWNTRSEDACSKGTAAEPNPSTEELPAQLDTAEKALSLDQRTRNLVDDLLAISSGGVRGKPHPARRIIYMREFDIIQGAAKPLMAHILQSLHESRLSARLTESSLPQSTIIVFGLTPRLVGNELSFGVCLDHAVEDCLFMSGLLITARWNITRKLHRPRWEIKCPCSLCANPRLVPPVCLDFVPVGDKTWGDRVAQMIDARLEMEVFATNVKHEAYEEDWPKDEKRSRGAELNRRVFRAYLEEEGWGAESEVVDIIGSLNPDVTFEIAHAEEVLTAAEGLRASARLKDNPVPSLNVAINQAYDIIQRRNKERPDWEKGIKGSDPPRVNGKPTNFDNLSSYAAVLKRCIVNNDDISTTFSDVFVDEATVDSLQTIITLPFLYPDYFNCGILAKEALGGILLYGPPGTGKTMLCRALAKTSGANMLHIQLSDINDKFVGESEKTVAGVFELAYRLAPCIVFIDEIDSLFSSRSSDTRSWERNVLTEFMQGMDGLKSAKKNRDNNIVVVGATNRPFDLDPAILRRMPRRILVDMPNLAMRKGILSSYLKEENLNVDVSIDKLAVETEGFSGSDLKNLCVSAALASVKEAIGLDWKSGEYPPQKVLEFDQMEAKAGEGASSQQVKRRLRTITAGNIRQAQADISKSVHGSRKDELYRWNDQYSNSGPSDFGGSTP